MSTSDTTGEVTPTRRKRAAGAVGSQDARAKPSAKTGSRPARKAPLVSTTPDAGTRIDLQADADGWQRIVAEAAYFRAERRGFVDGCPEQDWFEAEEELLRTRRETRV